MFKGLKIYQSVFKRNTIYIFMSKFVELKATLSKLLILL